MPTRRTPLSTWLSLQINITFFKQIKSILTLLSPRIRGNEGKILLRYRLSLWLSGETWSIQWYTFLAQYFVYCFCFQMLSPHFGFLCPVYLLLGSLHLSLQLLHTRRPKLALCIPTEPLSRNQFGRTVNAAADGCFSIWYETSITYNTKFWTNMT